MSPDNLEKLQETLANSKAKSAPTLARVLENLYSYEKGVINVEFSYNHTHVISRLIIRTPNETISVHNGGHAHIKDHANGKEFWVIDNGKHIFYFIEDITGFSIDELSFGKMKAETLTLNFS